MRGKKELKDGARLSILVEREYLEYLKQTAIQISAQKCRVITMTELIRQAIEKVYPMHPDENQTYHKTGTDQH